MTDQQQLLFPVFLKIILLSRMTLLLHLVVIRLKVTNDYDFDVTVISSLYLPCSDTLAEVHEGSHTLLDPMLPPFISSESIPNISQNLNCSSSRSNSTTELLARSPIQQHHIEEATLN